MVFDCGQEFGDELVGRWCGGHFCDCLFMPGWKTWSAVRLGALAGIFSDWKKMGGLYTVNFVLGLLVLLSGYPDAVVSSESTGGCRCGACRCVYSGALPSSHSECASHPLQSWYYSSNAP